MEEESRRRFYTENLEKIRSFTAVFAVSDYYALELMNYLRAQGTAVPDEISLIGFDDSPLCRQAYPPLTTIRQDSRRRAEEAIRILKELKQGNCLQERVVLPVRLVERESVRRL